ncbi:MAG TPA: TetR/AcrR family transcriptional regulator [Gammaproteobacteria bacterium]
MTPWSLIESVIMVFCKHTSDTSCRWRRRKEARPEEILYAALELFAEKGYAATRMNDVAKQAGISKGTLYLYFNNKEAIFHSVVQEMITPKLKQVEELVKLHEGTAEELLRQLIMHWWENIAESQLSSIPKLIISESGNFPELAEFFVNTVVKRARKLFVDVIRKGIKQKEFADHNPNTLARLVMAPMIQMVIWKHSLKPFDDAQNTREYIELHIELIIKALKKQK